MRGDRLRRRIGATAAWTLMLGSGLAATSMAPAASAPIPTGLLVGTVTGPGGAPLPGAEVVVYDDADGNDVFTYRAREWAGVDGDFIFGRLEPGAYKLVSAAPGFAAEYFNDANTLAAATALTVGAGRTAVPAWALAATPPTVTVNPATTDLTGVVTDAMTGRPIASAEVRVFNAATGGYVTSDLTDSAGRYAFNGLDAHPSVKVVVSSTSLGGRLGHRALWSGGARSKNTAGAITLTPGTPVTYSPALAPFAGLRGQILAPDGTAVHFGNVEVYDADSVYVDDISTRADGSFYLGGLNPGEAYRLRVGGGYYQGNDTNNDFVSYLDAWYADANSFSTATPIVAGAAGTFTPITMTLRDTVVALEPPSVAGDLVVGRTLTANPGRWNRNANSAFAVEWLRGATVVGTGTTYALTGADAGQQLALRVTLTTFDTYSRTGTVTVPVGVAKYAAHVTAKKGKPAKVKGKKGKSKKVKVPVTLTVAAPGQAAAAITGTVTVTEGKKRVGIVTVTGGKARFVVRKPGKHRYTLAYSGNATTHHADGTATITVKKPKQGRKR